jgi:lipopolysaccharide export system permease protein
MRLLDRYLFRELLTPLAYCLGGFLIFWNAYDLFTELQEMQERKLHLFDVLEYSAAMTPEFLVTVLPIGLLLALLYALTNHARHNEITAMRAAGVSMWRLCVPYFIVGLVMSAVLFGLNEWCVPRSTDWANRILTRHVQKPGDIEMQNQFHGFANARAHRVWQFYEYRVRTTEMTGPNVSWLLPNGSWRQLHADRAIRANGVWTFFNVKEFEQANAAAQFLPLLQTNALAMPEFDETPAEIQSEIKISGHQGLRNARKADIPLKDIFDYLRLHPNLLRADSSWLFTKFYGWNDSTLPTEQELKDSRWLFTKFYGRLAAPWTCLVVVLIAIPFGAASGRRNLFVGVAGSIFICFSYFVIQSVSLALGSAPNGHLPAWLAAWLPNIFFGVTGLVLTARVR